MSSFSKVIHKFPSAFWLANTMELFERWAWYGMFIPLALYLTGSTDTGALGFSQVEKGTLMGTVVAILYFLPVITGAIADKFGYRKTLIVAYIILASGYFFMGKVSSYSMVFLTFLWVALGAGLFKPVVQATVGKTTDEDTSSIGFGIFYMIVNVGAFIGPIVASFLRGFSWEYVFTMSAIAILANLVIVIFFFKEPAREKNTEPLGRALLTVLNNIMKALSDVKLLVFLILIIGFWTMYNQLFYTLPVFIDQWVHTGAMFDSIHNFWPGLANALDTQNNGTVASEMLVNVDALFIVLLQIVVSTIVMKYKPLNAMIVGILVCSIGISLTLLTQNGFFLILAIFIFAVGEMSSSPKTSEYIARIAPKNKVGLYMGCSFLPYAGGNFFAGQISGGVYGRMSDKVTLLENEVALQGLDIQAISETFTQNDFFNRAGELMGMNQLELTDYLWQTYNPSKIWYVVFGIGIATVILLWLYDKLLLRSKS
ncbi:MAG: MFS transporter [Bacteroidetes bacterium]|jgi:proton-dependent oligopeptide transporter, POT family|nr:MFS transporter [Bacteroidota bacterium]MBT4400062.1 MFS transporter [Bacteroidota bacterium]MBT4410148.1 MFS transporter [Bacteroidota bacterium]MBT5425108.1 MFS transporter [Bacteroidota bacterium]MBT7093701.1 MFS transporter [Bacteroidota bacterium]